MPADSTSDQWPVEGSAPEAPVPAPSPRRTPRVVALLFGLFLLLLGEIALTGSPAPVNAAYPHSLRAVTGEGCGGG